MCCFDTKNNWLVLLLQLCFLSSFILSYHLLLEPFFMTYTEIPTHGKSTSSHHRKRQYKGKHSTETHTSKDSNIKGQFYGETKSLEEDPVEDGSSFTSKTHSSHFLEEDTSLDDSSSSSSSSLSSASSSTLTRDAMITFSVAVFLLSSSQVSLFSDVSISSLSFLLMSICSMLLHIQLPSTSLISFLSCYYRNTSKTWEDYSSGLFFFLFLCCSHHVIWRTTIAILSVLLLIPRFIHRMRSLHWFFSKLFALWTSLQLKMRNDTQLQCMISVKGICRRDEKKEERKCCDKNSFPSLPHFIFVSFWSFERLFPLSCHFQFHIISILTRLYFRWFPINYIARNRIHL